MNKLGWLGLVLVAYVSFGGEMKTPETSKFFERHVDPESGVVSWIMKPGIVAHNQQHFYFTAKSMTDDGRFLMFSAANDEFTNKKRRKVLMMIDFLTDELIDMSDAGCGTPFVDAKTDQIWYTKNDGITRRDLLVDPKKEIRLCEFAPEVKHTKNGNYTFYCTHLTLSPDRKRCFLDWCDAGGKDWYAPTIKARQLLVDVETGKLIEEWGNADYYINHGQLNPVNPDLAMCAYEGCSKKWVPDDKGGRIRVPRGDDEVYPRIILVEKGKRTHIRSLIRNYATHEHWAEDGKGFYWCASGVNYCDLATGRQRCICPLWSAHATMTTDNRFVTSDCSWGGWWRGCGWTTSFWNRDTNQGVYIHTKRPVYASREKPSGYHPDPHPQFVCNDRYVCCTMNVKEHQMTVSLTSVEELIKHTTKPQPAPRRIKLEWNNRRRADVPYEIEFNWKKLASLGVIKPLEKDRPTSLCYESFGVEATLNDGTTQIVPVTALPGKVNEERVWLCDNLILRFTPPAGARSLDLLVGVGGRFEIEDAEGCDNLIADAMSSEAISTDWKAVKNSTVEPARMGVLLKGTKVGDNGIVTYRKRIPESAAGRSCKLDMEVRSISDMTWGGPIVIRQFDAKGNELPEYVVDQRWTGHMRPPNKTAFYHEVGYIHKDARELEFSFELRYIESAVDNYGLPLDKQERLQPKLLITKMILRPTEVLPFPGYTAEHFASGVSDDAADSSIRLGGEQAFCYQTRSMASWSQDKPMRRDDQIFFPRLAGTVEAWFKPEWKAGAAETYTLIEAAHSLAHIEKAFHRDTRGGLVELLYCPEKSLLRLKLKDFADKVFETSAKINLEINKWTHLAFTFEPNGEAVLWVDGKKCAAMSLAGFKPFELEKAKFPNDAGPVEVWVGGSWISGRKYGHVNPEHPFTPMCADELRISNIERYKAEFNPQKKFEKDNNTCALFGFNRDYDGVSANGPGVISGSYRSLTARQSRTIKVDGKDVAYYPDKLSPQVDFTKVLDGRVYKDLPQTKHADMARKYETKSWQLKANDMVSLTCPNGVVTDYIEYRNLSDKPLLYPLLINKGEIDPRSFGDIADTLVATCRTDQEKVNKIFNFVLKASNYSQNHHPTFKPGSDVPKMVEYEALMMLNGYCGFECGPLNNMAANLFACSGLCPASQTAGYGHSFEEVFYEGKNRIYDLSARKFFPAMDNETVADLGDADREFGVMARWDSRIGGFCRNSSRAHGTQNPAYQKKCGMVLNPGEVFRLWRKNNSYCNDLQLNSCWPGNRRTRRNATAFYKTDVAEECRAKCPTNTWRYGVKDEDLGRVDRFFPEYANGFLIYDDKPSATNPAFVQVKADSFCYEVNSCYPIVHAEYSAKLKDGFAALELSTDFGKTWFTPKMIDGKVVLDYPVRARLQYLVKVKAPIETVLKFAARTEVQANRRIMPGELRSGENQLCFKANSDAQAEVKIGYRVESKPIIVKGALFTGTIIGCECNLALVSPEKPLELQVIGASNQAAIRVHGGVKATLKDGQLIVSAEDGVMPRFAAVDIDDGGAVKRTTLLVAKDARLVMAKSAKLKGGAKLLERSSERANDCVMLRRGGDVARFEFAPLPKGEYAVLELTRYQSKLEPLGGHYGAGENNDISLRLPGYERLIGAGSQESLPDGYWWTPMGRERPNERGNFKWEYATEIGSFYPYQMMRKFNLPEGANFAEFSNEKSFPGGIEVAAVLVLPEPSRDFKALLRKVLCGYNCDLWDVE